MKRMDQEKGHKTSGRIVGLLLALLMLVSVAMPVMEASAEEGVTELDTISAKLDGTGDVISQPETQEEKLAEEEEIPAEEDALAEEETSVEKTSTEEEEVLPVEKLVAAEDGVELAAAGDATITITCGNQTLEVLLVDDAGNAIAGESKTYSVNAGVSVTPAELAEYYGLAGYTVEGKVGSYNGTTITELRYQRGRNSGWQYFAGNRWQALGNSRVYLVCSKNSSGDVDKPATSQNSSIVFVHQEQDNEDFANQDTYRPWDETGQYNVVKFIVVLSDENGNIVLNDGKPNVELPEGSVVPDSYEFDAASLQDGVLTITSNTFAGISVPGYSYDNAYAYFGWSNNTDLDNMAVVTTFRNFGAVSTNYSNYYSYIGFTTTRGTGADYSSSTFGDKGTGYYAYNPTGVLMIVLKPVSENIAYRTNYHNDYVPGGVSTTNIVDVTLAHMIKGGWIADEYRYDWYGETIMTTFDGDDLTGPAGYTFVGWYDGVDSEGNGTGNKIIGQTADGYYYAVDSNGDKIIIRQNNDLYARWEKTTADLTITKTFVGLGGVDDKPTVTATVKDGEMTVKSVTLTDTGGDGVYSAVVSGLEIGKTYTVTESAEEVPDYDLTETTSTSSSQDTGNDTVSVKIAADGNTVSFTNTYAEETISINYVPVTSDAAGKLNVNSTTGGSVYPTSETIGKATGTAEGSTATAAEYYTFVGWYADKECETQLSEVAEYVPKNPTDGATYYALFEPAATTVTIFKYVGGNMGDRSKEFTFTANDEEFTLSHGESEEITAKIGSTLKITETDHGTYEVTVKVNSKATTLDQGTANQVTVTVTPNMEVEFTNKYNVEIDTGITTDSAPYILMLALAAVGGLAYVLTRRKHA